MRARILGLRVAALATLLTTAACSQAGAIGDILGGVLGPQGQQGQGQGQGGQVAGEIQGVDTQRGFLQIRTQSGQTGNVYFDQNTRVVYQQREYPVTALERGDVVAMNVQQDQRGNAYTNYIQVQQSVQERTGQSTQGNQGTYNGGNTSSANLQRFSGTVGYIDTQRGVFELRTQNGSAQVSMPYNVNSQDNQRFRTLRSGQNIVVDGRMVAQGRIDLERFVN
ncbi:MAG TPA: hypothetical protein VF613_19105 [Longimicrobium sp.]|jgi:hypothetical protein